MFFTRSEVCRYFGCFGWAAERQASGRSIADVIQWPQWCKRRCKSPPQCCGKDGIAHRRHRCLHAPSRPRSGHGDRSNPPRRCRNNDDVLRSSRGSVYTRPARHKTRHTRDQAPHIARIRRSRNGVRMPLGSSRTSTSAPITIQMIAWPILLGVGPHTIVFFGWEPLESPRKSRKPTQIDGTIVRLGNLRRLCGLFAAYFVQ